MMALNALGGGWEIWAQEPATNSLPHSRKSRDLLPNEYMTNAEQAAGRS
jgi:hypothetical protein